MTFGEYMGKLGITQNVSYYHPESYKRGRKDVIIEAVWCRQLRIEFFNVLQNAKNFTMVDGKEEEAKEGVINLIDCLNEFEKPELLDEDNKWYCSVCKDHV
jgi:ubiquitin C-terminal hydrolase